MKLSKKTKKQMTMTVVSVFFLAAGVWYIRHSGWFHMQEKTSGLTEVRNEVMTDRIVTPETEEPEEAAELVVYICGEVNSPGIYTLPKESRLYEAVVLAGGFSEEADPAYHNLARTLKDGERIYIVSYAETKALTIEQQAAGEEGEQENTSLINLNTATAEQLMSLPGIGEAKAAGILAYREKVGKFADIEEIKNVSGIGEAMFEKIKDKITVK